MKTRAVPGTKRSCIRWWLMPIKFVMKFSIFYSVSREEIAKISRDALDIAELGLIIKVRRKESCHQKFQLWLFQGTGSSLRMALPGSPLNKDTELKLLLSFQHSLWESLWLVYPQCPHTNNKYLQCSLSSRVSRDGKSCLIQDSWRLNKLLIRNRVTDICPKTQACSGEQDHRWRMESTRESEISHIKQCLDCWETSFWLQKPREAGHPMCKCKV